MDKTTTNASYIVEIDPKSQLPLSIRMQVLAGKKGATEKKGKKIVGGEHVVFDFVYRLSKFDEIEPLKIPREAQVLLASR